jgi:hypothetical protein
MDFETQTDTTDEEDISECGKLSHPCDMENFNSSCRKLRAGRYLAYATMRLFREEYIESRKKEPSQR